MKRLEHAEPPECLSRYKAGRDNWGLLSESGDAEVVRRRLYALQGGVCAYCEVTLKTHTSKHCHIEHFARRVDYQHLTFRWTNLLLSCNSAEHCGQHKDSRKASKYHTDEIVNPTQHDPHTYVDFLDTGLVRPGGSEGSDTHTRGQLTIDVLNLNLGPLRKAREGALKIYKSVNPGIAEMLTSADDPDFVREYVEMELGGLHNTPFAAPIRRFLRRFLRY